jgi:hypothetical protein
MRFAFVVSDGPSRCSGFFMHSIARSVPLQLTYRVVGAMGQPKVNNEVCRTASLPSRMRLFPS